MSCVFCNLGILDFHYLSFVSISLALDSASFLLLLQWNRLVLWTSIGYYYYYDIPSRACTNVVGLGGSGLHPCCWSTRLSFLFPLLMISRMGGISDRVGCREVEPVQISKRKGSENAAI